MTERKELVTKKRRARLTRFAKVLCILFIASALAAVWKRPRIVVVNMSGGKFNAFRQLFTVPVPCLVTSIQIIMEEPGGENRAAVWVGCL